MKKAIKVFSNYDEQIGVSRFQLDSVFILHDDANKRDFVGTIVDKTGVVGTDTIQDLIDDKTKVVPLSRLYNLDYDPFKSSLIIDMKED